MTETRSLTSLTCPKCGAEMRTYERNEVMIDQCTECRGIFLDRGELERLIDAEFPGDRAPIAGPNDSGYRDAQGHPDDRRRPQHGDDHDERSSRERDDRDETPRDDVGHGSTGQRRRRGGLFGDVLDIFGGG